MQFVITAAMLGESQPVALLGCDYRVRPIPAETGEAVDRNAPSPEDE